MVASGRPFPTPPACGSFLGATEDLFCPTDAGEVLDRAPTLFDFALFGGVLPKFLLINVLFQSGQRRI
jgi:hypothetical protein